MEIDLAAARLEALGSTPRLAIFGLLVRAGPEGRTVGDVQRALDIPASTLSHHLQRLVQVGLVTRERDAQRLVCRAAFDAMRGLVDYLVAECCRDSEQQCTDPAAFEDAAA